MRYRVHHVTRYRYSEPVSSCHNLAHLSLRNTPQQQCLRSRVEVMPVPANYSMRTDYFGNRASHFTIQAEHRELVITASSEVRLSPPPQNFNLEFGLNYGRAQQLLAEANDEETLLAREFLLDSPLIKRTERLAAYALPSFSGDRPLLAAVRDLTERIHAEFVYDPGFTTISTPLETVMEHRRGVCQDFAHLAIGCLRAVGIPARYVSGYIETLPPPGEEKLQGSDASHAWFGVYSPGEGWFEFDPTNNLQAGGQHITAAWGRDYADVAPLKGVIFGGGEGQELSVEVDVTRLAGD